jgi:hypothetical protein
MKMETCALFLHFKRPWSINMKRGKPMRDGQKYCRSIYSMPKYFHPNLLPSFSHNFQE